MKVIDLLNKIANGEEVPEKIDYKDCKYEYKEEIRDYEDYDNEYKDKRYYERYLTSRIFKDGNTETMLNTELEIIEDKKIEPIKFNKDGEIEYCDFFGIHHFNTNKRTRFMADKINEIIDVINKGD